MARMLMRTRGILAAGREQTSCLTFRLDIQSTTVRPTESLKTFREACALLGIGKSGRKDMYRRLASYVAKYHLQQRVADLPKHPVPEEVTPVREPSEEAAPCARQGVMLTRMLSAREGPLRS